MIALGWAGIVLMIASAIGAIVARRRVWNLRLGPAVPAAKVPQGSVLLAARLVRGVTREVTPLLADWQARGVLEVRQTRGEPEAGSRASFASGPGWQFTVLDASRVGPVELPVLQAFVPQAPTAGATFTLLQQDARTRDRIFDAIHAGIVRQRAAFGPKPLGESLLAGGLVALSVVATLIGVAGFALGDAGPVPIAFTVVVGAIVIVLVAILGSPRQRPSDAEREYRQDVINFEPWIRSTSRPDPLLAGWAMVWDLPGEWPNSLPAAILLLKGRDRDFLRGDFYKRTPDPAPL